jgi:hypothetical protein
MNKDTIHNQESKLPVPGVVYQIPADTHADLDLQDDKEQALQRYSSRLRLRRTSRY